MCLAFLGALIATRLARLPGALLALGGNLLVVAFDATRSCLVASLLVADPALPLKPDIIAIFFGGDSEFITARSDYASSLAGREMVVEIDESEVMYTRTLDTTQAPEYRADVQQLHGSLRRKVFP